MGLGIFVLAIGLAACGGNETETEQEETTGEAEESVAADQDINAVIDIESIPDVIATVNGEDIEKEVYVGYLQQQASNLVMQGFDLESEEGKSYLEMIEDSLLQQMINETLIVQAANKEAIEVTEEEIDQEITTLISDLQMSSDEDLQALLEEQNVTMEELRTDIVEYIKRDKYIQKNLNVTNPTEEELKAAYDEMLAMVEDDAEVPEFEEYKDELEYNLLREQEQEQTLQLVETLRDGSEITIHI
jgi:peptidyl-prolyl cis-trans isomerase SurA